MYIQSSLLNKIQDTIFILNKDLFFTDIIAISTDKYKILKKSFLKKNISEKNLFLNIDYKKIKNLENNEFLRFENTTRQGIFEYNFVKIDDNKIIFTFKKIESKFSEEKMIKLKNDFISSVNHEFRTPLNGIIGISNSFSNMDNISNRVKKGLILINKNGLKLLNLIENLLNFSKLESQNYEIKLSDVYISEVLNFCNNIVFNLIEENKKNTFDTNFEVINNLNRHVQITSDKKIISEIFFSILTNAVKFTQKGTIKLITKEDHENIIFELSSTGLKISQDKMKVILTKMGKNSMIEKCKITGVGLLAKAKLLTEIIGGKILVEKEEGNSKIVLLIRKNSEEDSLDLKEMTFLKNYFISNIRAEFKIPLDRIKRISCSFLEENLLKDELKEGLKLINESAERLKLLITSLLDFSKLESGEFKIEYTPISISKLLDFIQKDLKHFRGTNTFNNKNIKFVIENSLNPDYKFICDYYILKNILHNILDNAVKFTDSGTVIFKIYETKNKLVFEIMDSGIGISKNDMKYMFKSFNKGDSAHKFSGLGIGLSKSKLFAEYIEGEIDIESEQGIGTKVCFSLPKLYNNF